MMVIEGNITIKGYKKVEEIISPTYRRCSLISRAF